MPSQAAALTPKPRDFSSPAWQASVTDEHIEKTILEGGQAVGLSMLMVANPDLASKPDVIKALRAQRQQRMDQRLDATRRRLGVETISQREAPLKVTEGIGAADHDQEGRVITAEYADFFLLNVYQPNSQRGLTRLDYRVQDWDHCDLLLQDVRRMNPKKYLYELYAQRVASLRTLPLDPEWDGTSRFETK